MMWVMGQCVLILVMRMRMNDDMVIVPIAKMIDDKIYSSIYTDIGNTTIV